MTKEEIAYADALNLIGSGVTGTASGDRRLCRTLGNLRYEALASAMPPGPKVRCPRCSEPFPYNGPADGEHFADLWEHLIVRHGEDVRGAEDPARIAWRHPVAPFEGVKAA